MLFQRLYNWIKYKTLPPSVLFKNRLFIERNSKHKRIFNNFGLVFRNSKWSNYEMYNLKQQFQTTYFKYLLYLFFSLLLLLLFFKFNDSYSNSYALNTVCFFFWSGVDFFDYYTSFLVWAVTLTSATVVHNIYIYFFFSSFAEKEDVKKYFTNPYFANQKIIEKAKIKDIALNKYNCNLILYNWLINPSSLKYEKILENVFDVKTNVIWWENNYNLLIKLYKLVFLCNLSDNKKSLRYLNTVVQKLNNHDSKINKNHLLSYLNNSKNINNYGAIVLWYYLKNKENYFDNFFKYNNSTNFLKNKSYWNISNLSTEKYANLIKLKSGSFFFNEFTFSDMSSYFFNFNELLNTNNYVKNQTNSAKWNRWLYRYSLLHRKILKNSHKLTISKKLFNSGIFNNSVFDNNIWVSENLKKNNSNLNYLNILNQVYYNNLFTFSKFPNYIKNVYNFNNNNTYSNNFKLLSFYENSYFWFNKRFYNFNSMNTNKIKSSVFINKNLNKVEKDFINFYESASNKYFILLSNFLKINTFFFSKFSFNSQIDFSNPALYMLNKQSSSLNYFLIKDLTNFYTDNEFFHNDGLNIVYWVTSTFVNNDLNVFFFNYCTTINVFDNLNEISLLNKSIGNDKFFFNYWLLLSCYSFDKKFLQDTIYFSMFY